MAITNAAILYPIRFATTGPLLRVEVGGVAETLAFGPVVVGRDYWVSGDGQEDTSDGEGDLLEMLKECLDSHSAVSTFTVAVVNGFVTVTSSAANFNILWGDGLTTLDATIFGFTQASFPFAVASATAPHYPKGRWLPGRFLSKDTRNRTPVVGSVSRSITGLVRTARLADPAATRDLMFELLPKSKALDEFAAAEGPYNTFETAWRDGISHGRRIRLYENEASVASGPSAYAYYRTASLEDPLRQRTSNLNYWDASLKLVEVD